MNVSNIGRAIPSFAILVLGTQQFGLLEYPIIGSFTTFIALVALAVPPLVTNAYVAVAEVPDEVRDAARGMGMSEGEILRRVELPMAAPLLMAGVRTAACRWSPRPRSPPSSALAGSDASSSMAEPPL